MVITFSRSEGELFDNFESQQPHDVNVEYFALVPNVQYNYA